ncbi:MAG: large conductance mechanosensitive channel protein MscL [Clostridia bacterium]|nr:large conductance mechanosensitive channel protein MscL [Clostridia bacterium]
MKKKIEKIKKENVKFWTDFKGFIARGSVLDLAVAVVIATAFNAIVNGLVNYIITPFITYMTSGVSIHEWEYVLREEVVSADGVVEVTKISIQYGLWLQTIVDFIIIALSIFVAVRIIRNIQRKLHEEELREKAEKEAKEKAEKEAKEKKEAEEKEAKRIAEENARAQMHEDIGETADLLKEIRDLLKEGK